LDEGVRGLKLEEITTGASLEGVEPSSVVTAVAAIVIPPNSLHFAFLFDPMMAVHTSVVMLTMAASSLEPALHSPPMAALRRPEGV
jgi:hypothetical protein